MDELTKILREAGNELDEEWEELFEDSDYDEDVILETKKLTLEMIEEYIQRENEVNKAENNATVKSLHLASTEDNLFLVLIEKKFEKQVATAYQIVFYREVTGEFIPIVSFGTRRYAMNAFSALIDKEQPGDLASDVRSEIKEEIKEKFDELF